MITSMTGFGTAEGVIGALRVTVEIRAVNHRFFNLTLRLPNSLSRWEGEVREALRKRFSRGHITVSAWIDREVEGAVAINEERFGAYVGQLRGLRDRFALAGDVDVATVMRLPDVLTGIAGEAEGIQSASDVLPIIEKAADALQMMRQAEGVRLVTVLEDRLAIVEAALSRLEERAPQRLIEQKNRLQTNITELAGGVAIDPQRLAQEVAILSDRVDVSEELNRFRIHIAAFRSALDAPNGDGVGKRLGFLLQEMLRETNTTGSKANDATMLGDVVSIKEELERLREQVENIE